MWIQRNHWQILFLDHASPRGSIYILFAASLLVFLGLAAIAVDIGLGIASNEQQLHSCEYAALAALEAYNEVELANVIIDHENPTEVYTYRLELALEKANEVAAKNLAISPMMNNDRSPFDNIGLDRYSLTGQHSSGPGGTLIPGQWKSAFNEDGTRNNFCPHDKDRCFVANQPGERVATAFRCEAKLESPIRTMLANILGQDSLNIQAQASAAMALTSSREPVSQELMFVVDLSESIAYDSHPGNSRRYVTSPPCGSGYQRFELDLNQNGHLDGNDTIVCVDQIKAPQPLGDLLLAVNAGIQGLFANRTLIGGIGLLGFDQDVLAASTPPVFRHFPLGTDLDLLSQAIDSTIPNNIVQHFLIPRANAQTNIERGLRVARDQLIASTDTVPQSIVLISDGLPTCRDNSSNPSASPVCSPMGPNQDDLNYFDGSSAFRRASFINSFTNPGIKVHTILVGDRYPGHTINIQRPEYLVCCSTYGGSTSGVHTCSAECDGIQRWMEYDEAMETNTVFVEQHPDDFHWFVGPNKLLYDFSKQTHGGWFPLRDQPPAQCCNEQGIAVCASPGVDRIEGTLQIYDPHCRSKYQQVIDAMKKIVPTAVNDSGSSQSGLILVE